MKHSAKHQSWFNRTSCIIMLKKKISTCYNVDGTVVSEDRSTTIFFHSRLIDHETKKIVTKKLIWIVSNPQTQKKMW